MYHDITYLNLLDKVLSEGHSKGDRTGTGTTSLFGPQIEFNLWQGFPLLTTKKINLDTVIKELLWFISGDTNSHTLEAQGCNIWKAWGYSGDDNTIAQGELGPVYGKQWTYWNGVNQLDEVVKLLKNNPDSRRILFHGWNPTVLPDENADHNTNIENGKQVLPPCHLLYQFYVNDGRLSCKTYQRSVDCFLGLPFNIASAAVLTHMLANICGYEVDRLILSFGDTHIYDNHKDVVAIQMSRTANPSPKLFIDSHPETIYDFKLEDFRLEGYNPQPFIKAPVAV